MGELAGASDPRENGRLVGRDLELSEGHLDRCEDAEVTATGAPVVG
jgi:hypothetical protein